jgi:hypothetical protein
MLVFGGFPQAESFEYREYEIQEKFKIGARQQEILCRDSVHLGQEGAIQGCKRILKALGNVAGRPNF